MRRKLPRNVRERDGKYHYRYSVYEEVGGVLKRKQKETAGFATSKEAESAGIRIKAQMQLGTYIEEKDILLSEWADTWLNEYYALSGRVKQSTVVVRKSSLSIAKKYFTGKRLKEITELQYQAFLSDLKKKGYKKKTIRMVHEVMSLMYRKAVQIKLIMTDVTKNAEMPGFQQTVEELENEEVLPEFMQKSELAHFLRVAKEHSDPQSFHALFILAYSGLRIGELCALRISDVDEANKQISITKTLHLRKSILEFIIGTPKTPSSKRKVDIGESALKIIKNQLLWRKEFKFSQNDFYNKSDYVFINWKGFPGYPLSPRDLNKEMKRVLEIAGLSNALSPHSLRHTYTSLMAEAGVELPAIQRLLGHQNDSMTRRVYLHITEAKKREAVDRLDALMGDFL